MSDDLSSKTICVVDRGLFTSWATKLSESFGRVLLFVDWRNAFPTSTAYSIGEGLPGVEKIDGLFEHIPEVDCFFFPDVYDGGLEEHLRSLGKPVWGSGHGEELELNRWETKRLLKEIGLPVQHVARVVGLDELRDYLKDHEDVYVKVSLLRGDCETFHSPTYDLIEPRLDELDHKLGARKYTKEFIVEDAISPALEVGYDGFTIDGQFPESAILGVEEKDLGYIGVVKPYRTFSQQVRIVNDKLSPILAEYQYRNFFSSEIRLGRDKEPYLTDPCCRAGSPPSEVYQEAASNWGEIVWAGAHGELVQPKWNCKYCVEAMIHCGWAAQNNEAIYFPKEIEQWVKLRNGARINDHWLVMPQTVSLPEVGAVVAVDNTLLGAIKKLKSYADKIEGYDVTVHLESIQKVLKSIDEGQKKGIQFTTEPLPTLSQVAAITG